MISTKKFIFSHLRESFIFKQFSSSAFFPGKFTIGKDEFGFNENYFQLSLKQVLYIFTINFIY